MEQQYHSLFQGWREALMSDRIRAIIVDDESYNREELKYLLSYDHDIEVIDEASSGKEAILKIIDQEPSVVFLDVDMPGMNGMEVAKTITGLKKPPLIVFATAYPEFAVEAFRYQAVDYLLKPYDEKQLLQAIERMKDKRSPQENNQKQRVGKLAVDDDEKTIYINPDHIKYIYYLDKHAQIVTTSGHYHSKLSLKAIEARLKPYPFYRIHKGYLVNITFVQSISPWFNGAYHLKVSGESDQLPVSRNYIKGLRDQLEL